MTKITEKDLHFGMYPHPCDHRGFCISWIFLQYNQLKIKLKYENKVNRVSNNHTTRVCKFTKYQSNHQIILSVI